MRAHQIVDGIECKFLSIHDSTANNAYGSQLDGDEEHVIAIVPSRRR
jgi:hypothetical protein